MAGVIAQAAAFKEALVGGTRAVVAFHYPGAEALLVSMRGLQAYLALSGVIGFAYLAAAALIAPRTGIALYTGAVTAGTLIASVALDHVGAFGGDVQRVSPVRVLGVLALLVGVLLVRDSR